MSSKNVTSLLNTLQSQLSTGDYDAANETFTRLSGAYTTRKPQEKLAFERSNVLRTTETISEPLRDRLTEFENQYQRLEFTRMSVLGGVSFFMVDPTEASLSEVTSALSSAADTEDSFQEKLDDVAPELNDVDVPPQINMTEVKLWESVVFVGESTSVGVEVQNVGSDNASDVSLEISGRDISVSSATQSFGDIEPGATESASVKVSSDAQGMHDLKVIATSSNAGTASKTTMVSFTTPIAVLKNRIDDLETLKETVRSSSLTADVKDGLVDKLNAVRRTIRRAISVLTSHGKGGPPPEKSLNTAINQLGAYLNQINAVSDHLSASYEFRLRIGGETNIEELASVRAYL